MKKKIIVGLLHIRKITCQVSLYEDSGLDMKIVDTYD